MPLELPHDFVKEFNGLKNRTRNLIIVVVVFGIGGMLLIILGDKNIPNFLVQVLYVLVTILMVYVISYQGKISALQAEIMRRQIKILEVDKLPMLMFQKIDSSHDREIQDKKQENNLNSTENQENDIQVGKLNLAFEILNVSKYPVRVECVGFIPSKEHNEIIEKQHEGNESRVPPHAVRLHTLFGAKGRPIPPNQKIKVPDMGKGEADITVPGVLRIKASNEYFPDLVLEYEYDIGSGRINKIEENPNNNSGERENEHNRATTDDEAVENNDENDDLFGVYYEHTKKVTPYLTVYSALITVSAIFLMFSSQLKEISTFTRLAFTLTGILFGLSGFFGASGSLLYVSWRGKLSNWKGKAVDWFIQWSFILFFSGLTYFFLFIFFGALDYFL